MKHKYEYHFHDCVYKNLKKCDCIPRLVTENYYSNHRLNEMTIERDEWQREVERRTNRLNNCIKDYENAMSSSAIWEETAQYLAGLLSTYGRYQEMHPLAVLNEAYDRVMHGHHLYGSEDEHRLAYERAVNDAR